MSPPEWQNGEDQPSGDGGSWDQAPKVTRSRYPDHFTPSMSEVYDEMMKQIKMCMLYFGINLEQAIDILRLVQSDIKYHAIRGRFS